MRVAVVGAGIFGCTVAIKLAKDGHKVVLIEKQDSILRGASTANQLRLHAGFHYPRSPETMDECREGEAEFVSEYGKAADYSGQQFYAIARDPDQKTNPMQYQEAMSRHRLVLNKHSTPPFELDYSNLDAIYEVNEAHINLAILRNIIWEKLWLNKVDCRFGCRAEWDYGTFDEYDKVVVCTYGQTPLVNEVVNMQKYHYELIEKPLVKIHEDAWKNNGLVVMDGPFYSIDPLLGSDCHLLGHVVHCIHDEKDSYYFPKFDDESPWEFLDKGLIPKSHFTYCSKVDEFIEDMIYTVPSMLDCTHVGSYFTVRAVKANVDDTDERPTIVRAIDDKYIDVFSGKIGNCVKAAKEVAELCLQ